MKQYLVIDIGGTAIKYALMNQEATIISQDETPTPYIDKEHFLRHSTALLHLFKRQSQVLRLVCPGVWTQSKAMPLQVEQSCI